jgi:hypothetical protein
MAASDRTHCAKNALFEGELPLGHSTAGWFFVNSYQERGSDSNNILIPQR